MRCWPTSSPRVPRRPGLRPARSRVGGRKPKLSARQAEVARGTYAETGSDGKRRYAVDEVAGTFAVSRKTIYRHLDKNHAQRQPDKSTRPRPVTRPGDTGATCPAITPAAAGPAVAQARPQRQRHGEDETPEQTLSAEALPARRSLGEGGAKVEALCEGGFLRGFVLGVLVEFLQSLFRPEVARYRSVYG